jgi:hypothetical protein
MTQAMRTQEPQPEAGKGTGPDDRQSMDNLVAALNRAVSRKQASGMGNTEYGT